MRFKTRPEDLLLRTEGAEVTTSGRLFRPLLSSLSSKPFKVIIGPHPSVTLSIRPVLPIFSEYESRRKLETDFISNQKRWYFHPSAENQSENPLAYTTSGIIIKHADSRKIRAFSLYIICL